LSSNERINDGNKNQVKSPTLILPVNARFPVRKKVQMLKYSIQTLKSKTQLNIKFKKKYNEK